MAEYIEREAALATMCKYCCEYDSEDTECTCNERLGILEIPSADVVPVVRCASCKYHNKAPCPMRLSLNWTKDKDFCSYGERREDDGTK